MTYELSHVWTKIRPAEAFLVASGLWLPSDGKSSLYGRLWLESWHYPHRGCFCFAGGWRRCRIWRWGGWEKVPRLGWGGAIVGYC